MIQQRGDLWTIAPVDARCITTNACVKRNKKDGTIVRAVMGAGVAAQAALRYPELPRVFGEMLVRHVPEYGNRPMKMMQLPDGVWLVSYPTKGDWRKPADPDLMLQNAVLLRDMADKFEWKRVVLPRVGAGRGERDWDQTRSELVEILDDRFVVAIPE